MLLLLATWVVALLSMPDPSGFVLRGVGRVGQWDDFFFILYRNGARAGPARDGVRRRLHGRIVAADRRPGPHRLAGGESTTARASLRSAFVAAATLFSLSTQAYALGAAAATAAADRGMSPGFLHARLLPHALPELCALFLPLAAWIIASRRGAWNTLLAATFVTTAIAVPVLVASAAFEVWVTPHVLYFLK